MTSFCRDIEHWLPRTWDDIVGNYDLKEYGQDLVRKIRKERHRSGFNAMLTGHSRSGKTSGFTFAIKALACQNLDFNTFNPCGTCLHCKDWKVHINGNRYWELPLPAAPGDEVTTSMDFHFSPVNSPDLTDDALAELMNYLRNDTSTIKMVYLDEILRLDYRLAAKLLAPMDKYPVIWLASSAYLPSKTGARKRSPEAIHKEQILKMFQGRFTFRLHTQPPSQNEMVLWLGRRCQEFGILCEEPEQTLSLLAERSLRLPGLALQVLNRADKKRERLLTRELVETHAFELEQ